MIKVFTLNKNGKIELTKEQLESLLNQAYYEGKGYSTTYTYTTPYYNFDINKYTVTCNTDNLTNSTSGV